MKTMMYVGTVGERLEAPSRLQFMGTGEGVYAFRLTEQGIPQIVNLAYAPQATILALAPDGSCLYSNKLARILDENNCAIPICLEGMRAYRLEGDVFGACGRGAFFREIRYEELLAPVACGTIYGLGANHHDYSKFLQKIGREQHEEPVIFTKPAEALTGMSGKLVVPAAFRECGLKGSGELGVILKRDCYQVPEEEALDYVLGYTNAYDAIPANRYFNVTTEEKHAGKRFATFCPMGPYLDTALDVANLLQQTFYNAEQMLDGRTDGYVWSVARAVSRVSQLYHMKQGGTASLWEPWRRALRFRTGTRRFL